MNRPTPEQAAKIKAIHARIEQTDIGWTDIAVLTAIEYAAEVERERDATVAVLTKAKAWIDEAKITLETAAKERSETVQLQREEIAELKRERDEISDRFDGLVLAYKSIEAAPRDRDQLQKELDELARGIKASVTSATPSMELIMT